MFIIMPMRYTVYKMFLSKYTRENAKQKKNENSIIHLLRPNIGCVASTKLCIDNNFFGKMKKKIIKNT